MSPSRARVVLLGASNLTVGFATVLREARRLLAGPLEVLAAIGNGRSYGIASTILGRTLPGIDGCGLWRDLKAGPEAPTYAVIADIGNDIAYQVPVDQVCRWVDGAIERLQAAGARCVLTLLPLDRLRELSPIGFQIARQCLFPFRFFSHADTVTRAEALQSRLIELAAARGVPAAAHRREWYGADPIHILKRRREAAWREILASWSIEAPPAPLPPDWRVPGFLRLAPERRKLLGLELRRRQPCAALADGSTLSIY
jgi:hypothetical protein